MSEPRPVLSLVLHLFGEPGLPDARRDEIWRRCHGPVLDALERLPRLRVGLVLAGETVQYWEDRHPDRLDRVRALVREGRVELVATPLYEPVLSAVPERDATEQLLAHVLLVRRVFEVRPAGSWLPYRVWDPGVPKVMERAELGWCLVDDHAIARHHPGRPDPWGVWWTERGGHAVRLFAADARALEMSGEVPAKDLLIYARGRAV
jgi:alpha-amylase